MPRDLLEKHLQNDLFYVEWDQTITQSINLQALISIFSCSTSQSVNQNITFLTTGREHLRN